MRFACGDYGTWYVVLALVSYTLSGDFLVTFWAWFGNSYCTIVIQIIIEPRYEISNNVVCATSKESDQPQHTRSLIRAFASCLNII